jgi:hypothetical protein
MHPLRKNAVASPRRDHPPLPDDARFDSVAGVWRTERGLLADDKEFDRTSKKMDLETGEDEKGQ